MVYLTRDGGYQYRTHTISEALDRNGTESLHTQYVAEEPLVARVHDASGRVFAPHQVDDAWVMPSLDPGDVVGLKLIEPRGDDGIHDRWLAFLVARADGMANLVQSRAEQQLFIAPIDVWAEEYRAPGREVGEGQEGPHFSNPSLPLPRRRLDP